MSKFKNYYGYVESEANDFVDEYIGDLLEEIKDGDTNVNEFVNDSRLNEWCDNNFIYVDLRDYAEILEQSSEVEEDSGLWEGISEPEEALKIKAFFTYRNDMYFEVRDKIQLALNEELENKEQELEKLQEEKEEFEDELGELDGTEDCEERVEELEQDIEQHEEQIEELEQYIEYINDAIEGM